MGTLLGMRSTRPLAPLLALVLATGLFALAPTADATTPPGDPADGATERALPADALTAHVDGPGFQGLAPDGSTALPYPTIKWAVAATKAARESGRAVRIVVAPGTYRENVRITGAGANGPLVLESAEPGSAVVTGADLEARWTPVEGTPLVQAPWLADWGLSPVPSSWGDAVQVSDGVRRREGVSVDGQPLAQVLRTEDLTPGTFLVDEAADALYVHPPADAAPDLRGHVVEVSTRPQVLEIGVGAADVTVRGFTFQAGAPPFTKFMATVSEATDVVVEANRFRHSGWGGLFVCCAEGVTVRGNVAEANGGNGIDTYKAHDVVVHGNVATGNNVRGARNDYVGWSVAGSKNMLLHGAVFRDNVWDANWARGLWFDTDVVDVLVDGDRSCGNFRDGLFLEALAGPITLRDSTFCGNGRAGVIVSSAGGVTLEGSTLADNPYGQLVFSGERTRSWTDHETGASHTVNDFTAWTLRDNRLRSGGAAPLVLSPVLTQAEWRSKLQAGELRAKGTVWDRPSLDDAIMIYGRPFAVAEWNSLTGDGTAVATKGKGGKGAKVTSSAQGNGASS